MSPAKKAQKNDHEPADKPLKKDHKPTGPSRPYPAVVGIGASAGGLAALRELFARVPAESGLAYVIVVHLSPEHESYLPNLLQAHVRMPVQQVTGAVRLEANQVYVIPPNANLSAIDTHLRLSPMEGRRKSRAPIDHFFRTLAQTHDRHAIGVILTGTGSDGTLGIKEIKEKGGLVVVQDPNEAEYDGMPQSAIATGLVDLILPIREIPGAILRFLSTEPRLPAAGDEAILEETTRLLLQKTFTQIRVRTGRDFSHYKQSTILRRIARRMQFNHVEEFPRYLDLLRKTPAEVNALADDLLVTVTNFFRDAEVFEKLEKEVIPKLFDDKTPDDQVRVWSVGCATGEEAYSLAMLLLEEAARRNSSPRLQVFASDLHEHSLVRAREGFYPGDIETDVSLERLRRFFRNEDSGYRVRAELREMVVFAPHNLLGDPPFSRMDLIVCRNVLIYLQRDIHRDIIDIFHYALRQEAFLVLGASETIDSPRLFRPIDKKCRIYRKRNVPAPELHLPIFPMRRGGKVSSRTKGREEPPVAYGQLHQRMLDRFGPPSVLVGPEDSVVHLSERAGRYLVFPGGEPTVSAFRLVRPELRIELRAALHAARESRQTVRTNPVPVQFNGESTFVILDVRPGGEPHEGFALVVFEERESAEIRRPAGKTADDRAASVSEPEAELELTRQRLQAIIEEYDTSQEEMRSSNEEMQSANEELRSTMEELETSKEELQSINEELQTVSQENRHKVEELSQLTSDLHNLLSATEIAILYLDRELCILRFTPKVTDLFNVRMTDRGRPISDLTHRLGYENLEADAGQVLRHLTPIEREVEDEKGRWYLTRLLPYRSTEDRIEGLVITFTDITGRKEAERALDGAKIYAESIVATLHEPLLIMTPDLRIKSVNQAFYNQFGVSEAETIGREIYDLGNGQWSIPELRRLLEEVLPESNVFNDFEVTHTFENIGERVMLLNARRLDHVQLILLGIRDITDRERGEQALRWSEERFRALVNATSYVVYQMSPDWSEMRQLDGGGFISDTRDAAMNWLDRYIHPDDRTEVTRAIEKAVGTKSVFELEHRVLRNDGTLGWTLSRAVPFLDEKGEIVQWLGAASDVTERKEAEETLRRKEERFRRMFNVMGVGVLIFDQTGTLIESNAGYQEMTGYTPEDIKSGRLTWRSMTPPEYLEVSEKQLRQLEQTGRIGPYEKEYLRKDGSRFWMLFAGASLGDGTVVEYCIDISDRKRGRKGGARE